MATSSTAMTIEYSDLPTVLIFTDDPGASGPMRAAVEEAGGRVGAVVLVADALDRLAVQAKLSAVIVELRHDAGPALDALLEEIDRGAASGRFAAVMSVKMDLVDATAARIGAPQVTILCEPTAAERGAAVAGAIAKKSEALSDIGSGLKELADEVARIAKTLASLANEDSAGGGSHSSGRTVAGQASDSALIRAMIRVRRLREQFFPAELFADPAWDMLLDLTAAKLEGRMVAVSSLCIASAVPPTTALRWIKTLTDGNLFERVADSNDGRRVFIELTEVAETGMLAYLAQMQRILTLRQ